jgi:hypothetical protein
MSPATTQPTGSPAVHAEKKSAEITDKDLAKLVAQAQAKQDEWKSIPPEMLVDRIDAVDEITALKQYCIDQGYIRVRPLNDAEKAEKRNQYVQQSKSATPIRPRYSEAELSAMRVEVDHFYAGREKDTRQYVQNGYMPIVETQNGVDVHLGTGDLKAFKIPAEIINAKTKVSARRSRQIMGDMQEEASSSMSTFDKKELETRKAVAAG